MNLKKQFLNKFKQNEEFSKNFVWRMVQTFGKQGASFAIFLIATYFISKEEMGIYNYVFSALALLTLLSDFGISTATSKYVAEYNSVNKEKLKKVFFNTALMVIVISTLVSIVVLMFGKIWFKEYYQFLLYGLPLIFFVPITALYDGIYRGLKKFKDIAIISLITGGLSLIAVFFLVQRYGLVGALIAQNFMYLIYFLILAFKYGKFKWSLDKSIMKEIGNYSLAFGIATLGFYLFSRINVLILGNYNLLEEIATYELLNRIFIIYLLPFTILGQVIAPYVTELFSLKKYVDVRKQYWTLAKILTVLSVLFIPVTMLITRLAIKWFFPKYDTEMFTALLFPITLTYCKSVFSAPLNAGMIVATGDAGIMTVMNLFVGAINIVGSLWAIERYGYMGVIWVTMIVQYLSLILLHIIYARRLKKHAKN